MIVNNNGKKCEWLCIANEIVAGKVYAKNPINDKMLIAKNIWRKTINEWWVKLIEIALENISHHENTLLYHPLYYLDIGLSKIQMMNSR